MCVQKPAFATQLKKTNQIVKYDSLHAVKITWHAFSHNMELTHMNARSESEHNYYLRVPLKGFKKGGRAVVQRVGHLLGTRLSWILSPASGINPEHCQEWPKEQQ